jgi:NADH:ubiquinone oxidoreductase subunit 5 (subunit L)/multisubunit Na+/H+ antiporter MnhA subunit
MNIPHLHLILNHLPIFGIPVATLFLAHALISKNQNQKRMSLFVLIGLGLSVLPVYFTGEPVEHFLEKFVSVSESAIEPHEDAALIAMILTLLTTFASTLGIFLKNKEANSGLFSKSALVFAIAATISLAYTGFLGGKIRHTEFVDGTFPTTPNEH